MVGRPTAALLFLNDRPEKARFFKLNVIKSIFIIGNVPDLDEENEMTELRKRMSDAMVLRGLAKRTQESYLACVEALAKSYWRSPDTLDGEAIQSYLLHLITEKKLAYASVNQAACAFRFLFGTVLGRETARFDIPMAKVPKRLSLVSQSALPAMPDSGEGGVACRTAARSAARALLSPGVHAAARPQWPDCRRTTVASRDAVLRGIGNAYRIRRQPATSGRRVGVLAGAA